MNDGFSFSNYGAFEPGLTNLTATGTTQATAAPLRSKYNRFTTVPPLAGCQLPWVTIQTVTEIVVINSGANMLYVYPPPNGTIDSLAVNAPASLTAGQVANYICYAPPAEPGKNWITSFQLQPGVPGAFRSGAGAPANTLGSNGDYYLDTTTGNLYLKSGGSYSVVCSLATGGPFLPLSGGTMSGALSITVPETAIPAINTTVTYPGNTGASSTVEVQTVNNVNINGATGTSIWANRDILSYSAPSPASGQPTYIARSMLAMAQTDRGPSGPQIWGAIVDVIDTTTHPSSVGGNLLALEVNVEAGGVDDANIRQAIVINVMNRTYPTTPTCEINNGLHIVAGDAHTTMHNPIKIELPFSTAAINLNGATSISNAPAIWLPQGAGISFDNSKYTNLLWNTADSAFEFQWNGAPVWSLDSAGDMTVKQNVWIGQGFGISFDGGHNTRLLWSGADGAMAFQWAGGTIWKLDPGGSMTVSGNSSLHQVGFNGTAPIAKPTVTGAKGGNAALASLLTALVSYGLVTDSTGA